jgi:hypothetical protein
MPTDDEPQIPDQEIIEYLDADFTRENSRPLTPTMQRVLDTMRRLDLEPEQDPDIVGRWRARCPLCDSPSLIFENETYDSTLVFFHCWEDCDQGIIRARLMADTAVGVDRTRSLVSSLVTVPDLAKMPDPDPLIADTIDQGSVALLAGTHGVGKSFLAVSIAAAVATGLPWNRRTTVETKTLYIAAEGAYTLRSRFAAWQKYNGVDVHASALTILPRPVNLSDTSDVNELGQLIHQGGYGLVIIDTLARCMVGVDENSAKDMGVVVDALYFLQTATNGGTILAVHHTGKSGTVVRGSSALEAGIDVAYLIEKDGPHVVMTRTKRKDGPLDDKLLFEMFPVEGTESIVPTAQWSADNHGAVPERADELLRILVDTFGADGASQAQLQKVAEGFVNSTFARSVKKLLETGLVINTGTPKRRHLVPATVRLSADCPHPTDSHHPDCPSALSSRRGGHGQNTGQTELEITP